MQSRRSASAAVVAVGALWGFYWFPWRRLAELAPLGPWLTVIVVAIATLLLLPAGWQGRHRLARADGRALVSTALGGWAFVLYADGLLYGNVAVVILLFYLTPVWSSLIARFWLGRRVSWWRWLAIAAGLGGITLVLHGSKGGLPVPRQLGDWLGLASGLLWAVASTGMHRHGRTGAAETNFLFCLGGTAGALALALVLGSDSPGHWDSANLPWTIGWALLIGGVWWAGSLTLFVGAAQSLEPPRVAVLLMSEVLVGTLSAALLAAEPFGVVMGVGTAMVIAATLIETLPEPQGRWSAPEPPG